MRYAPTARLQYSDEVAVPWMIRDFARKLALIAQHETHSPEAKLKLVGAKKTLANEVFLTQFTTKFTCFTSTKVHILTPAALPVQALRWQAADDAQVGAAARARCGGTHLKPVK